MSAAETLTIWRCTSCGKWSHAVRCPKFHQRWTPDEPGEDERVLRYEPPSYDREGNGDDGGYVVACGPFEAWAATRAAPADPGADTPGGTDG
jgi:hypothetical protein